MLAGNWMSFSICSMAFVASPSEAPGARLNDSVTTGHCPWWLTARVVFVVRILTKAESGTGAPLVVDVAALPVGAPVVGVMLLGRTYISFIASGVLAKFGRTSSTTWYWFNCVKMMETCRCPKASYRVLSMACGRIPRRDAVSRSMLRFVL